MRRAAEACVGRAARSGTRALGRRAREWGDAQPLGEPVSNFSHAGYLRRRGEGQGLQSARATSSRWCRRSAGASISAHPPFALYRALRRTNPSPFMFYFNFGPFQVVGASPEILVRVFGGEVTIRPIAGYPQTRADARGGTARSRPTCWRTKRNWPSTLMLLDLGRNDVGPPSPRSAPSARPREFIVERYSPRDAYRLERGGRACRRITTRSRRCWPVFRRAPCRARPRSARWRSSTKLEPEKRGVYGGGVGYFSAGRRHGHVHRAEDRREVQDGTLYIQAGGGVVYDSDPQAEFEETGEQGPRHPAAAAEDAGAVQRAETVRAGPPGRGSTRARACRGYHAAGVFMDREGLPTALCGNALRPRH